jgi:hypothetical protein
MKSSLFTAILISSFVLISSGGFASDNTPLEEEKNKESLRVQQQKEAEILEKDRDYTEKSNFVKNRDRVEGATEQAGKAIEKAGKEIGDTVKKLF